MASVLAWTVPRLLCKNY